jgi:DNA repair photolyase
MAEEGDRMSMIYEPKGKAREYSPLALNVYSGGCDHGCRYCYCSAINRGAWSTTPRVRSLAGLGREACSASRQILLSFMSDPYCAAEVGYEQTLRALEVLHGARCSVAILTKGGARCLRDLDMFRLWPDGRIKVGATLTFRNADKSVEWEPGAAAPDDRLAALRKLHEAGVKTWASIEPVIEPSESLAVIEDSLPYVDAYKVGRWNHDARANAIDWAAFGRAAVDMIRSAGKALYVKVDLRPHFQAGFLVQDECSMDALELQSRK